MGVDTQSGRPKDDRHWMGKALEQAELAAANDEVPIGAVLVDNSTGELLASGHNQPIGVHDPTAHAEIIVLREAARRLNNYRLPNTTLYVTIEPCVMCVGALVQARVARIVYGAPEPKTGAIESAHRLLLQGSFNHCPEVRSGLLKADCSKLITDFFEHKRQLKKSNKLET
jgi:tRNA(adenine34) deaminase